MCKNIFKSSTGQAIVEYLLILSILVVVGGGILYKFSSGMQKFGKTLFGPEGQVACLLESGLLPHQASSRLNCKTQKDAINTLQQELQNISNNTNSTGGRGKTTTSNKASSEGSNSSESPSHTSSSSTSGGGKSRGRGSTNGASNNSSLIAMGGAESTPDIFKKSNKKGSRYKVARAKKRKTKAKFSKGGGGAFTGYGQDSGGRLYSRLDSAGYLEADEEIQSLRRPLMSVSVSNKAQTKTAKNKPMLLPKRLKKTTQLKDDDGFSFGASFRIILIIAIIGIIAFIIFTQVNSVRQSLK